MLPYPSINPIAFSLGPIKVHWYGLMYAVGFIGAWILASYRANKPNSGWTMDQVSDLIFYTALGVILGGRIGYMLFYDFTNFLANPWIIFQVWQGGMSFHGGLLGVLLVIYLFGRKTGKHFFDITDFAAPLVPIGLGAGRIGNFINGELWGRVTDVPWAMVFPHAGQLPRHPSQLYEFFFEGILLFSFLWIYSSKKRPRMAVSGWFALLYGAFRFILEFFRQPDTQIGFIAWNWLTMGQLLSLPMIIVGLALIYKAYATKTNNTLNT
ncbi:prolipoprotein diacylglyceryl transferase [Rickettsiella endosymbiont of Dermanyssus gallinae]|uniref:prolipoprotein diacylglyceryl transferase n=1 Tax=Rickettsiella endosymbiont of Dermanyssus gallinae TaxID=2856608 RepID=UPI001C5330B5|nr:prolipoprotein diacylglyceryl transferase [Rickettsiella endosymbiont of Dermanyssus gallinae]